MAPERWLDVVEVGEVAEAGVVAVGQVAPIEWRRCWRGSSWHGNGRGGFWEPGRLDRLHLGKGFAELLHVGMVLLLQVLPSQCKPTKLLCSLSKSQGRAAMPSM